MAYLGVFVAHDLDVLSPSYRDCQYPFVGSACGQESTCTRPGEHRAHLERVSELADTRFLCVLTDALVSCTRHPGPDEPVSTGCFKTDTRYWRVVVHRLWYLIQDYVFGQIAVQEILVLDMVLPPF